MITIQVKVTGHELSFISSPILSSDSIQFDRINFQFDSNWDGFNKVALFWGGDSDTPYGSLVDAENNATIPAEVIAEKGTIRFGVYGEDPEDLRPRITSTILKYKVREGTWSDSVEGDDEVTETLIDQLKQIAYSAYGNAEQFIEDAQEYLTQAQTETAQNIAQNNAAVAANIQQNNAAVAANIQQNNAAITEYIAGARETTQEYLDEVTEMAEGAKDSAKVAAQAAIDAAAPCLTYSTLYEQQSGGPVIQKVGDSVSVEDVGDYDYIDIMYSNTTNTTEYSKMQTPVFANYKRFALEFGNNNYIDLPVTLEFPYAYIDSNASFQPNRSLMINAVLRVNRVQDTITFIYAIDETFAYSQSSELDDVYINVDSNIEGLPNSFIFNVTKIVGWKYSNIASKQLLSHDPELLDVRIGADGTIYASAGDAVRGQIEEAEEIAFASYPARETSGAMLSFLDGGDNAPVKELNVDILSASGVTGASIERLGKNLANISDNTYTNSGITFTISDGAVQMAGTSTATINRTIGTVKLLAGVTYTISGTKSSGISDADVLRVDLRTSGGSVVASGDSYNGFTYTPNADTNAQVNIRLASGQTLNTTIYPQIEIGSIATEFEPYSPTVYTVDWTDEAGTVYGGTLDVINGLLTVDRIMITIDGSDSSRLASFSTDASNFNRVQSNIYNDIGIANIVFDYCDLFEPIAIDSGVSKLSKVWNSASAPRMFFGLPKTITTLDEAKAWFASNVTHVIARIASPQVYQLTPVDVRTLLGSNIFSADCGDISMVYRADPALSLVEKYEKPSTGIPKTDLAADVQTSLGKADTALQSAPVTSVAGKTGAVTLDGGDVGYSVGSTYSSGTVGKSLQNTENGLALLQQTVDQLGGDKIPFDFSGYVPSEESIADVVNEISDDVADLKSQITQHTKNLFDPDWLNSGVTKDGEWYSGTGSSWAASSSSFVGEANTQYTLSVLVKAGNAGAIKFIFNYSDGTTDTLTTSANLSADTLVKKTTASGKTVASITFSYGSSGTAVNKAKDIQLEQGANATSYVPFLTAYDFLATQRLNRIESIGLDSYPQIKDCAFDSSKFFRRIYFTVGQKLLTDGRIVSDAAYSVTGYIFLAQGESITYDTVTYHTNVCAVGKFDLAKTNLTIIEANTEAEYVQHSGTYVADSDCFIFVCGHVTYKRTAQYTGHINPIQQLAKVTAQNAFKAYSHFADIVFTDGIRVEKNGNETSISDYSATNFIYLGMGESLYYSVTNTNVNTAVLSVYDLYQTLIETLVSHTSGEPDVKTGTYTATQDCFVRVCGRAQYAHVATYEGIKSTVTSRLDEIESTLPEYWESYLETKKPDINTFISGIGNTGDYFALFTDYHVIQNAGWTPRIVKNLCHDYPLDMVVNLGDNYNSESTAELAIERLNSIMASFKPIKLLNCLGNHDENPYAVQLTPAQYYNPLFKETEMYSHSVQTGGGYYYVDNEPHKIRYIFLNTRSNGFTSDDVAVQLPWFVDVLNSVSDGWHVCILMHIFFDWQHNSQTDEDYLAVSSGAVIKNLCDAYQTRGSGTEPTKSIPYDFSNAHGKMACILSGHTHKEHHITSTAGYTIISFDRDGYNYPPPPGDETPRTKGTVSEQAIYFVGINTSTKKVKVLGIGAGSDMEFDFD